MQVTFKNVLASVLAFSAFAMPAAAELKEAKGNARIDIKRRTPTAAEVAEAEKEALAQALKRYLTTLPRDKQRLLRQKAVCDGTADNKSVSKILEEKVEDFALSKTIVLKNVDSKMKMMEVVIKAEFDSNAIDFEVEELVRCTDQPIDTFQEKVAMIMVAREKTGTGVDASWKLASSRTTEQQLSSVLSETGLELSPADFLSGLNIDDIRADFGDRNELTNQTRVKMIDALRRLNLGYVLIGTLDIDKSETDSVSGNIRSSVIVTADVLEIRSHTPYRVMTMQPTLSSGLGSSEQIARTNAVKEAANKVGKEMLAKLALEESRQKIVRNDANQSNQNQENSDDIVPDPR